MDNTGKKQNTNKKLAIVLAASFSALLIAALVFFFISYSPVGGVLCPRDAVSLDLSGRGLTHFAGLTRCDRAKEIDLRGNGLTPAQYDVLREKLPDCRIFWDVPLGGGKVSSETTALKLPELSEDAENVRYLTALTHLTVESCDDAARMDAVRALLPEGCAVAWSLTLGEGLYPTDSAELTLPDAALDADELTAKLAYFPELRTLTAENCALDIKEQLALRSQYPAVDFRWPVTLSGGAVDSTVTELSPDAADAPTAEALEALLPLFPALERLELTDTGLSDAERLAFREAHPELKVAWTVMLFGEAYAGDTTELILNDKPIDAAMLKELTAVVPQLPELQRVEMCDCGVENAEMDALCRAFPSVRFIWRIYFGAYDLRTDEKAFIAANWENMTDIGDGETELLRYCVDMEALDLGHMKLTNLDFVQSMPHLKYLIVAECPITDCSALAGLQELKYLEIFQSQITDISCLLECPSLSSLNLSYTSLPAEHVKEILPQLTWVRRIWYCGVPLRSWEQKAIMAALPDCTFFMSHGGEPSGSSWRYHDDYYEMRDALGMYYMPGGTNGRDSNGYQIIVDDWGDEWHLKGWRGQQRWWELPQYADWDVHIYGVTY